MSQAGVTTTGVMISAMIGALVGLGVFTFHYGEGLSYFSKDPAACVNCHIMRPQYESWEKSSHHAVATCVDCHLPREPVRKWMAKARNGYLHSRGFTLQDFPEPIFIREKNSRILNDNCLECHGAIVSDMLVGTRVGEMEGPSCVHCHRSVGHGEAVGLGKWEAMDEALDAARRQVEERRGRP